MIDYLTNPTTARKFSGTPLETNREYLESTDLYSLIDNLKRKVKNQGVFDPSSAKCHHSNQCRGVYWKQFQKYNQAFEGLQLTPGCVWVDEHVEKMIRCTKLLYRTEEELKLAAFEEIQKVQIPCDFSEKTAKKRKSESPKPL